MLAAHCCESIHFLPHVSHAAVWLRAGQRPPPNAREASFVEPAKPPKRKGILKMAAAAKKKASAKFGSTLTAAQKKQQQHFEDATEERNQAIISKARIDIDKILDEHPDKTVHFLYLMQSELSVAPKRADTEDDPSFINQTTTLSKVPQTWLLHFLPTLEPLLDEVLFSSACDLNHSIAHRAASFAFCVGPVFRMKVLKYTPSWLPPEVLLDAVVA